MYIWAMSRENLYANNKDADQCAHPSAPMFFASYVE